MASKSAQIAHLNLPEIATSHGVAQSKVKEIAFGLLDARLEATTENIAEVFSISRERQCDPLAAIDELAKQSQQFNHQEQADPLAQTVNLLSDQVYQSIAPLAEQVTDNVRARFAVNVLGNLVSNKKQGKVTKSVFETFDRMVKGVALEAPSLQRQISAAGNDDFLSLPSASEPQQTVTEVA